MKRKIFFAIVLVSSLSSGFVVWRTNFLQKEKQLITDQTQNLQEQKSIQEEKNLQERTPIRNITEVKEDNRKKIKVPFTSQAPSGNWSDQRLQNGCEEASTAMAMRWVAGKTFSSANDAEKEILSIADFEGKNSGNYVDASLEDVGKILLNYYGFKNYSIKHEIVLNDLKKEIASGNIVLVPAFGRALKNPNYTLPGPITHMLVVVGYDALAKEFITNDSGTKKGENYRYDESILFSAIWEYPAGDKHPTLPDVKSLKKGMIVINSN